MSKKCLKMAKKINRSFKRKYNKNNKNNNLGVSVLDGRVPVEDEAAVGGLRPVEAAGAVAAAADGADVAGRRQLRRVELGGSFRVGGRHVIRRRLVLHRPALAFFRLAGRK